MDQTADGKRLKLMPVVDEFTRECHAIEFARSILAQNFEHKCQWVRARRGCSIAFRQRPDLGVTCRRGGGGGRSSFHESRRRHRGVTGDALLVC
jgi:hypothetical protein